VARTCALTHEYGGGPWHPLNPALIELQTLLDPSRATYSNHLELLLMISAPSFRLLVNGHSIWQTSKSTQFC